MVLHDITNVKHRLSPYLPRGWHSFCVAVTQILKKHLKWFCPVSEISIRVYGSWIHCVCFHNEAEHRSTRNTTNRKQKMKTNQGWDGTSKTCPYQSTSSRQANCSSPFRKNHQLASKSLIHKTLWAWDSPLLLICSFSQQDVFFLCQSTSSQLSWSLLQDCLDLDRFVFPSALTLGFMMFPTHICDAMRFPQSWNLVSFQLVQFML